MSVFSHFKAKKSVALALLTTLALIAFTLENLLPPFFIPGAKAGISNVFSLLALVLFGPLEAVIVVAARTILGSVIAGNPAMLLYSFTAGEISILFASALFTFFGDRLSLISVSIFSAVVHNTIQLFIYRLLSASPAVYSFFPYLVLLGTLAGLIVGAVTVWTIKGIPSSVFDRLN